MAVAPLRRKFLSPTLKDIETRLAWSKGIRTPFALMRKPLFGDGYLAGTFPDGITTVDGVPVSATVRVVVRGESGSYADGMVIDEVQSSPSGTWQVANLDPALKYDVIGRLFMKNDVIVSGVAPKVDGEVIPSYSELILSHDPVGYWRLGEASGTVAQDLGSFAKNGAFTGTYTLARPSLIPSDQDNKSFGCNGTGYVRVVVPAGTYSLVGTTWMLAFKATAFTGDRYLWHLGNLSQSGGQGLEVLVRNNKIMLSYLTGGWQSATFTALTLETGVTYRMAFRMDNSTTMSLLVNGALVQTIAVPAGLPPVATINELRLGMVNYSGTCALQGDLDEFVILPKLLTDAEFYDLEAAAMIGG